MLVNHFSLASMAVKTTRRFFLGSGAAAALSPYLPASAVVSSKPAITPVAAEAINPAQFAASMFKWEEDYYTALEGLKRGTYVWQHFNSRKGLRNWIDYKHTPFAEGVPAFDHLDEADVSHFMHENLNASFRNICEAVKPFYDSTRKIMTNDPVRAAEIKTLLRDVTERKAEFYAEETNRLWAWEAACRNLDYTFRDIKESLHARQYRFEYAINWFKGNMPVPEEIEIQRNSRFMQMRGQVEAMAKKARLDIAIVDCITDMHPNFRQVEAPYKYDARSGILNLSSSPDYETHAFLDDNLFFSQLARIMSANISACAFDIYRNGDPENSRFAATQMENIAQQAYRRQFEESFPGVPVGTDVAPLPTIDAMVKQLLMEKVQALLPDMPRATTSSPSEKPLSEIVSNRRKTGIHALSKGIRTIVRQGMEKVWSAPPSSSLLPDDAEHAFAVSDIAPVPPAQSLPDHQPVNSPAGDPLRGTRGHRETIEAQRAVAEEVKLG